MPSNAARGAAWKARTRRWLEHNGWIVVDLEIVRYLWTPAGRFPQKRDQLGSDLLAVSAHGYLWVQVKGYAARRPSLAKARRALAALPSPPATRKLIVLWRHRATDPEVVECP